MLENPTIVIATGGELIALAGATGMVIGDLWVVPSAASQPLLTRLRLSLWRLLGLYTLVFAVCAAMELLMRTASMSELPLRQAYTELGTVLFKTHYGELWLWRAAAVLGLGIIWLIQWRRNAHRLLPAGALATLIVIVITLSASGHAGDEGVLSLPNFTNSLHILGALMWGGGIIAYALLILPALTRGPVPNHALVAESSLRLSTLAGIALALTVVPGLYNAWALVGGWHEAWTTLYGQVLMAKSLLVGAMIALGAVHRYRYVPSLQLRAARPLPPSLIPIPRFLRAIENPAIPRSFLRSLRVEALLLLGVLSLAAALSQQVPAAHAQQRGMPSPHHAESPR